MPVSHYRWRPDERKREREIRERERERERDVCICVCMYVRACVSVRSVRVCVVCSLRKEKLRSIYVIIRINLPNKEISLSIPSD